MVAWDGIDIVLRISIQEYNWILGSELASIIRWW